jgi:hypothetical protein
MKEVIIRIITCLVITLALVLWVCIGEQSRYKQEEKFNSMMNSSCKEAGFDYYKPIQGYGHCCMKNNIAQKVHYECSENKCDIFILP